MDEPTEPAPLGLVTCAISPPATQPAVDWDALLNPATLWGPAFPSAELVDAAGAAFPINLQDGTRYGVAPHGTEYRDLAEGPWPLLTIGPGMLQVSRRDGRRAERAAEEARHRRMRDVDLQVAGVLDDDDGGVLTRSTVSCWSRKSRARLVRKLCVLDLAPLVSQARLPCMVTLTLPGDWFLFAPTAKHAAALLDRFALRWSKRWGSTPRMAAVGHGSDPTDAAALGASVAPRVVAPRSAIWKREFQRRGAPHWALWTVAPCQDLAVFRAWLSETWNAVVFAYRAAGPLRDGEQNRHLWAGTGVDIAEGMRARDPKRLATYFLKESGSAAAKAYQNEPPAEWAGQPVGRYWGVWGLQEAVVQVALSPDDAVRVWRALRRLRERALPAERVQPERTDYLTGEVRRRRRPVNRRPRVRQQAGWVAFNDAPAVAWRLAKWVSA